MMKKVITASVAILISTLAVSADPAKKVDLTISNDTLTVTALHKVKDVKKHYINKIDIIVGDSLVSSNKYTEQTSKTEMVETFIIPKDLLVDGVKIYAETVCNKYGEKTGKLVYTPASK